MRGPGQITPRPFSLSLFTKVPRKGKFSELRLEETLPSPVIEGLGKEILQRERR